MELTADERQQLVHDIATRAGTASELAKWYDSTVDELRQFAKEYKLEIEMAAQSPEDSTNSEALTATQLDDLWITKKFDRLMRLQHVADLTYDAIQRGGYGDATLVREFRSYLTLAANELGQLLHRGSGDSSTDETLSIQIKGVDMEALK